MAEAKQLSQGNEGKAETGNDPQAGMAEQPSGCSPRRRWTGTTAMVRSSTACHPVTSSWNLRIESKGEENTAMMESELYPFGWRCTGTTAQIMDGVFSKADAPTSPPRGVHNAIYGARSWWRSTSTNALGAPKTGWAKSGYKLTAASDVNGGAGVARVAQFRDRQAARMLGSIAAKQLAHAFDIYHPAEQGRKTTFCCSPDMGDVETRPSLTKSL